MGKGSLSAEVDSLLPVFCDTAAGEQELQYPSIGVKHMYSSKGWYWYDTVTHVGI